MNNLNLFGRKTEAVITTFNADENGNIEVIKSTSNPDVFIIRVESETPRMNNGFLSFDKRSALFKINAEMKNLIDASPIASILLADAKNVIPLSSLFPQGMIGVIVNEESYTPFYEGDRPLIYPELNRDGSPNPLGNQPQTRDGKQFYRQSTVIVDTPENLESKAVDKLLPFVEELDSVKAKTATSVAQTTTIQ